MYLKITMKVCPLISQKSSYNIEAVLVRATGLARPPVKPLY